MMIRHSGFPMWLASFSSSCWKRGQKGLSLHDVSSSISLVHSPCVLVGTVMSSHWTPQDLSSSHSSAVSPYASDPNHCSIFASSPALSFALLRIGWPRLLYRPTHFGTGNKQHCCVGCHQRDAMLVAFDETPGNTIKTQFWSLHCFRRRSRSQVS